MEQSIKTYQNAVDVIKTAILQSQARAVKAVNQEQLALYYGIGRYVSANTRKKNCGKGTIEAISSQLYKDLPGLREFSARNRICVLCLKNGVYLIRIIRQLQLPNLQELTKTIVLPLTMLIRFQSLPNYHIIPKVDST